ncbi:hypothetical protein EDD11_005548 [Mortierella claussenii]|nr:hypothetical protein EDD11_005548 [Mortierella claussenii]
MGPPIDQPIQETTTIAVEDRQQTGDNVCCESCLVEGKRIRKFGKLRLCKECESVMRAVAGSSRRCKPATSADIPQALIRDLQTLAEPIDTSQWKTISTSKAHPMPNPTRSAIAPSSPVPISMAKNPVARKQRSLVNACGAKAASAHIHQSLVDGPVPGILPKAVPSNFHSLYPSSGTPRQTKRKVTHSKHAAKVEAQHPRGDNVVIIERLASPNAVRASKTSVPARDISSEFQTTGAFLTRTASRLLGGESVTGDDSNIHGYSHGRVVKVLSIDGKWYFGTMVGLDHGKIKVHFDGWGSEWDEWLPSDSKRLKALSSEEVQERETALQALREECVSATAQSDGTTATIGDRHHDVSVLADRDDGFPREESKDKEKVQQVRMWIASQSTVAEAAAADVATAALSFNMQRGSISSRRPVQAPKKADAAQPLLGLQGARMALPQRSQPSPCSADATASPPCLHHLNNSDNLKKHTPQPPWHHLSNHFQSEGRRRTNQLYSKISGSSGEWSGQSTMTKGGITAKVTELNPCLLEVQPRSVVFVQSQTADSAAIGRVQGSKKSLVSIPPSFEGSRCTASSGEAPRQYYPPTASGSQSLSTDEIVKDSFVEHPSGKVPVGLDDQNHSQLASAHSGFLSLGNPIQLGLAPFDVLQFEYPDEEKAILDIIHRVLDTGLIKNRIEEDGAEDLNMLRASQRGRSKARLRKPDGHEGSEQEDLSDAEEGYEDDEEGKPRKLFTRTRDRLIALLEARQENKRRHEGGCNQDNKPKPIITKDFTELQQIRRLAMRNMCGTPLFQFDRQIMYNNANYVSTPDHSASGHKRALAKGLLRRKLTKQRRVDSLSSRILGLSKAGQVPGITFNEAGYIETPSPLKPSVVVDRTPAGKSGKRPCLETLLDPEIRHDENQMFGQGALQALRNAKPTKKRKRNVAQDSVAILRRTMVPGTRITARDRQMDWLTAVIRDVKNSRVLVHYEGHQEFFNEWIDINSERLRYDASLAQSALAETRQTAVTVLASLNDTMTHFSTSEAVEVSVGGKDADRMDCGSGDVEGVLAQEGSTSNVHCVQCQVKISQFRIYCMYCEVEAKGSKPTREPFNLCLWCFSNAFPERHDHHRSSFATKVLIGPRGVHPVKGGIITRFEQDLMDTDVKVSDLFDAAAVQAAQVQIMMGLEGDPGFVHLDQWKDRYNGVLMCEDCFMAGPLNEASVLPSSCADNDAIIDPDSPILVLDDAQRGVGAYATSVEDYFHTPYLTRTAVSAVRFDHSSSQAVYLDSYAPSESQLYSLPIDTTYYDIPGRAPRCDLSRFTNATEFQNEMKSVIRETYRLLKSGRRCTLGIGDNRERCFYVPVSFQLIRQYINEGFELEELIVKRQRYCSMFGLGTYLCVQFDFLCFTHEFIATLRKIPKEEIDSMILEPGVHIASTIRSIPSCPIERKSVVMGSVWTFKPTEQFDFATLCVSRMVERFGKNDANWEEFKLTFASEDSDETQVVQWMEQAVEALPPEEEEMVSYERDRLQQIQENNRMLLALGLTTDLSETSDDVGHQIKIAKNSPCFPPPAEVALRMVAHIPGSILKSFQVSAYRSAIMKLACEAAEMLPISGVFVVGAQDIRTKTGKLIPLSMLLLEDIERVAGNETMKLKELIQAVPNGYQKDRRRTDYQEEVYTPADQVPTTHLPIVHACYLVFIKVKESKSKE